jgi:hypothetical protein
MMDRAAHADRRPLALRSAPFSMTSSEPAAIAFRSALKRKGAEAAGAGGERVRSLG